MIKIIYTSSSLNISGHANCGPKGKDLVCAAISGIVQSALSWFKKSDIKISQAKDEWSLSLTKTDKDNKTKLDLLVKQLKAMGNNFPKSIKINKGK